VEYSTQKRWDSSQDEAAKENAGRRGGRRQADRASRVDMVDANSGATVGVADVEGFTVTGAGNVACGRRTINSGHC